MNTRTTKFMRRDKGFTLVEVMVAVFLLTVAFLALISVTVTVIQGNSFSKSMSTATTLARDQVEALRLTDYDSLPSGSSWSSVAGFPGFERSYLTSSAGNHKTIQVQVRWMWQGGSHVVTLNTIVAPR